MIDAYKLRILTDSAKYDVSCSSSGSSRKNNGGLGNASYPGICHSFTPDGRCISLLKILLSNKCTYDCLYCVNRRSNDVKRASCTPDEICQITTEFYKRNYIEGLFLSSAVEKNPDYTMERLLDTVIRLRKVYGFNGYIHLKGIPGADRLMLERAAMYADRMSFNIELPSEKSLALLAPQKSKKTILLPMRNLAENYLTARKEKNFGFLPAGQTTQMIVGATPETDGKILRLSQGLYNGFSLKRVYYSSYIPANFKTSLLPAEPTGLMREHRLYQADWLLRFYGFTAEELLSEEENLDMTMDPKCSWAMKNLHLFPIEVNTAPAEMLLKVPGIGFKSASKICAARKYSKLDFDDLMKMRVVLKRAVHFITANGKFCGQQKEQNIKNWLMLSERRENFEQLSMFSDNSISQSVLRGEL